MIENEELSGFLKDLLELVKKVTAPMMVILILFKQIFLFQQIFSFPANIFVSSKYFLFELFQDYDSADLADFAQTIMKGCDMNRDGKISKKVKYVAKRVPILIPIFYDKLGPYWVLFFKGL